MYICELIYAYIPVYIHMYINAICVSKVKPTGIQLFPALVLWKKKSSIYFPYMLDNVPDIVYVYNTVYTSVYIYI